MATEASARWIKYAGSSRDIGGKAGALSSLRDAGVIIPEWFAITPPTDEPSSEQLGGALREAIETAVRQLSPNGALLAVRSSALDEDGAEHSFAGQFESHLYVHPRDVPSKVLDIWRSAASERVAAYRRERGLASEGSPNGVVSTGLPAVLVQRMIDPEVAGVAFSADPVSGRRGMVVVSATYGVGSALVGGDVNADTYHVGRDGNITERIIADKHSAHRQGPNGPVERPVSADLACKPALSDEAIVAVASLARATERHFGRPQDIEWALADGRIYLLQSRPITSLSALADPDATLALWDNSNITESYGGVTTPLTFSFARYVYEEVYRQFCRILRVPDAAIAANGDALRAMLGLIRGRVYYNLVSWYRILALLPGYQLNRRFMEQMMGVKEGLPPELEAKIEPPALRRRTRDAFALGRTILGLIGAHRRLPRDIADFHERLDASLALDGDLTTMRADELVAHYRELERRLLTRWDAPLVNDFFAMIFYGVLRSLTSKWCGDANGTLQNDLVSGEGAIVSAEPAKRIARMAELAARDPAVATTLRDGTLAEARVAVERDSELAAAYSEYLERFGDRCLEELKLETSTLVDDPLTLLRAVGRLACARVDGSMPAASGPRIDVRGEAEDAATRALRGSPVKRLLFQWVLKHARARVRDRENLRFERTRVFGRVRRIFVELGRRYASVGALDDPRDVFYLTVDEALGWSNGITASTDIRGLAAVRTAEFKGYRESAQVPADRFETRGMVHVGHDYMPSARTLAAAASAALSSAPDDAETRRGTGCYPGVIRGRVRVVRDPRGATLEPGEILVAERTDPGWVMLFPAARGLLVERGSLLSHSAIVARELGLPAVVAVDGLTSWLETGDEVEFDGRTGEIRRLAHA